MDLHLEGKVVILTGGFKGIGKGVALRLAKEGAIVRLSTETTAPPSSSTPNRNDNLDLDHTSWREFEQSLHGNLTHYYELAHRCAPYLRESKGAIVDISSKTALTGQGKTSAYAANLLVFDASNNDYYEAGGKASDTQPEDKRGLEVDPKFVGFSGGSDTPAGKLAGMAPKPRPTSTRHTPPPSCAWASTPSRPACSGRRR